MAFKLILETTLVSKICDAHLLFIVELIPELCCRSNNTPLISLL